MIFWKIAENVPKIENQNATHNLKQKQDAVLQREKLPPL